MGPTSGGSDAREETRLVNGADGLAEEDCVAVRVGDQEGSVAEGRVFEVAKNLNLRGLEAHGNFE